MPTQKAIVNFSKFDEFFGFFDFVRKTAKIPG